MWKKYGLVIGALVIALVAIVYYAVQLASYQPQEATPSEQELSPSAPSGNAESARAEVPAPAADIPPAQLEGVMLPPQQPPPASKEDIEALEALPPTSAYAGTPPPAPAPIVISYDGKAYSPATIDVKKGDLVMFVNKGTTEMWPASAMHPTHAVYPTTGGCIGSTFDACAGTPAGGSWSFVFDQAGAWKYHDHLNPGVRGTVNVK